MNNKILLLTLPVLFLGGCLATRSDVREGVRSDPPTQEQQSIANNEVRYQELEAQNRQLVGRIETLENSMNILSADKNGSRTETAAYRKSNDEKIKILEDAVTKLESENATLLQRIETLRTAPVVADTAAKDSLASKKNAFDQAEAEYGKKKWKDAIVLYQKYRDTTPTGKHVAESTYKIGSAFHELGMKTEAKTFYADVTEKFPKSEWAKKASAKMKLLK